ncbi:MAG TPA: NAD(P) transhydrogenase subunit alpha, partial [Kofleriaceae bacterium]
SPARPRATGEITMSAASLLAAAPAEAAAHGAGPAESTSLLFVFLLATFIGLGVVTRVSRLLHTPLMSLTNAISSIAIVGSLLLVTASGMNRTTTLLGAAAISCSAINAIGGFMITERILKMFKRKGGGPA